MDKQRERSTIEAFLLSQGYPISSLDWDRESPDGLVQLEEGLIGLEVTEVTEATPRQEVPPQMWTDGAKRVVRFTQTAFEKLHSVALVVSIGFRPEWRPDKRQAAKLGDELVTVIEEETPSESLASGVPFKPFQVWEPHRDVSWLYIGHHRQSLVGHWAPAFGGEYQGVTADDIQETVRRKEAKLKAYRLVAPTVWLLIDCDLSGQGIALDVSRLSSNVTVSSGFDKVFCCGFGRFEWVEIPCIKS